MRKYFSHRVLVEILDQDLDKLKTRKDLEALLDAHFDQAKRTMRNLLIGNSDRVQALVQEQ